MGSIGPAPIIRCRFPTGGAEGEEPRAGSNGPPEDFTSLHEVFPGLRDAPGLAIPLAPIDSFLGLSALADDANLVAMMGQYRYLIRQIKAVDPSFADKEVLPPGGIAGLSWQGRSNLLDGLRMQRAAAFCKVRGDVGPLQVETLRFLQNAVDRAYAAGGAMNTILDYLNPVCRARSPSVTMWTPMLGKGFVGFLIDTPSLTVLGETSELIIEITIHRFLHQNIGSQTHGWVTYHLTGRST